MQKYYTLECLDSRPDKDQLSLDTQIEKAKKRSFSNQDDYGIFELIRVVKYPIPEIPVITV